MYPLIKLGLPASGNNLIKKKLTEIKMCANEIRYRYFLSLGFLFKAVLELT